jgi:putative molybdopterin biosynthesis protein
LLIRKELLDIPEVRKFMETLKSIEFAAKLPAGAQVYERTGEMVNFD